MKLVVAENYAEMSQLAAVSLLEAIKEKSAPLICPASGDTPSGLYRELKRLQSSGKVNTSDWYFTGLDEWAGMNGEDAGSCRDYLNRDLFHPLGINEDHICFLDGRASSAEEECIKTERFIKAHGGIDVAIVGLGMNGHIGMNEPGSSRTSRCRVVNIDPDTQQVGQKYFETPKDLSQGLTLGIANILEAKHIFLCANGRKKAASIKKLMESESGNDLPAVFLKPHASFTVFLDKEAAALL